MITEMPASAPTDEKTLEAKKKRMSFPKRQAVFLVQPVAIMASCVQSFMCVLSNPSNKLSANNGTGNLILKGS